MPDQDRLDYTLFAEDLGDNSKEIIRAVVEDEKGCRGIAFLSVRLVRGRAKFTLTTKKHRGKETTTSAVADWVI